MVPVAEWDGQLVADLASERACLSKSGGGGHRRVSPARQAGLQGHIANVRTITRTTWLRHFAALGI
jgi:hypothetical protein